MLLINILEIIGTIAFAISGALIGIEKQMDLFGVIFLSITTSVGGGIFRDLIIGSTPPVAFTKPVYFLISTACAIITCIFYKRIIKLKNIILISDAIGLGVFTAIGSNAAITHNMNRLFIVISMGLITGIGGGILRDVFAKDIPFVFRKEIYAVASMLGGLGFYFAYNNFSHTVSIYVCLAITFMVRIISVMYNINLPVLKGDKGHYQI
jgi:Predicted membrane protein